MVLPEEELHQALAVAPRGPPGEHRDDAVAGLPLRLAGPAGVEVGMSSDLGQLLAGRFESGAAEVDEIPQSRQ